MSSFLIFRADPSGSQSDGLALELRVNDKHVVYAYGEHGSTGGVTVALSLKARDTVHVVKAAGSEVQHASVFSVARLSL